MLLVNSEIILTCTLKSSVFVVMIDTPWFWDITLSTIYYHPFNTPLFQPVQFYEHLSFSYHPCLQCFAAAVPWDPGN
jgi:hypothetical protein